MTSANLAGAISAGAPAAGIHCRAVGHAHGIVDRPFDHVLRGIAGRIGGDAHPHHEMAKASGGKPEAGPTRRRGKPQLDFDEPATLDPMARHAAHLAPTVAGPMPEASPSSLVEVRAHASLEELLPAVARRVAWSSDGGRRGAVRIEVAGGELAGATVVVTADDGRVSVDLEMPSGAQSEGWQERIAQRLASRGLEVDRVDVR
jgi:hypothetical protein